MHNGSENYPIYSRKMFEIKGNPLGQRRFVGQTRSRATRLGGQPPHHPFRTASLPPHISHVRFVASCRRALDLLPTRKRTLAFAACPSISRCRGAWGAPPSPSPIYSNAFKLSPRNCASSNRKKLIKNLCARSLKNSPARICLPTRIRVCERGPHAASSMSCDSARRTRLLHGTSLRCALADGERESSFFVKGGHALTTDSITGYFHMYHHVDYPRTGRSVQCLQCPAHLCLGLSRRS